MTEGDSLSVAGNGGSWLAADDGPAVRVRHEPVHAPDGVADELAALASRGASGALQASGEPGGTIEDGACTVVGRVPRGQAYADIRWTRPDPAVLRQILAELRQLG